MASATQIFELVTLNGATNAIYKEYQFKLSSAVTASTITAISATQMAVDRYKIDLTLGQDYGVKSYFWLGFSSFAMWTSSILAVQEYQILSVSGMSLGPVIVQQKCAASTYSATELTFFGP